MRLSFSFAALTLFLSYALAGETNAQRMRRGLPPFPPTRRSQLKKPVHPHPSGIPSSCHPLNVDHGYVGAFKRDGSLLGYVSKTFDKAHAYTLTTGNISTSDALVVSLPSVSPYHSTFNILTTMNGPDGRHPYFAAVAAKAGNRFGHRQRGTAYLAGTTNTPPRSPPSAHAGSSMEKNGYNGAVESHIWSLDCHSRELRAQWTNPDRAQPPTTIFFFPGKKREEGFLGIAGDLDAFDEHGRGGAFVVTLRFIEVS
ncbi:hypothetical protein MKEN_00323200 [Mycena kentingensis (nom. inval.)]|nr:hypothetical protein MKEN_00323200 [Mycena kentingensis (nom. inval.)]